MHVMMIVMGKTCTKAWTSTYVNAITDSAQAVCRYQAFPPCVHKRVKEAIPHYHTMHHWVSVRGTPSSSAEVAPKVTVTHLYQQTTSHHFDTIGT